MKNTVLLVYLFCESFLQVWIPSSPFDIVCGRATTDGGKSSISCECNACDSFDEVQDMPLVLGLMDKMTREEAQEQAYAPCYPHWLHSAFTFLSNITIR